jgi:hypothetical protein
MTERQTIQWQKDKQYNNKKKNDRKTILTLCATLALKTIEGSK